MDAPATVIARLQSYALKLIQAARAARKFPGILDAVAEGRLHLSAVVILAPHLTAESAEELLVGAEHRTKAENALLLAERFPRPDVPTTVQAVAVTIATGQLTREPVDAIAAQPAPGQIESLSPPRPTVPSGDIAEVVKRRLATLVEQIEKRVFAASARPRSKCSAVKGRYVPAEVRRTVWQRDGGRCTFESATGQRCPACTRLESDHAESVAGGGDVRRHDQRIT